MRTVDDDLELRLRESLHLVASCVEPPEGLSSRIVATAQAEDAAAPEGRSDRHGPFDGQGGRRWLPLAAAAAVVAVVVASALVASRLRHEPSPARVSVAEPVAWSAFGRRATTDLARDKEPAVATAGLRACKPDDFRLASARPTSTPRADGWVVTTVVMASTSTGSCSVSQYGLDAELVDATGRTLPQDAPHATGGLRTGPYLVTPGQLVVSRISWAVVGGSWLPSALVVLPSPGKGSSTTTAGLRVPLAGVLAPTNPRGPTNSEPWRSGVEASTPAVVDAGSLASLTARLAAPASVHQGATLDYTVTLRNGTDEPVRLEPCPDVVEVLSVVPQKTPLSVGFGAPLNCGAAAPAIAPAESVAFRMRLDTSGVVGGAGRLTWQLVGEGTVLEADSPVQILP